jgi:hypothetical protein
LIEFLMLLRQTHHHFSSEELHDGDRQALSSVPCAAFWDSL